METKMKNKAKTVVSTKISGGGVVEEGNLTHERSTTIKKEATLQSCKIS